MVQKLSKTSSISVGVPETAHSVSTICPSCRTSHSVLLATSEAEADAMRITLQRAAGIDVATGKATYATETRKVGRPRKVAPVVESSRKRTVKARQTQAHDMQTLTPTARAVRFKTPVVPPHMLRPRFRYYAVDRRKNPDVLSPTRARIYKAVANAAARGVIEADLLKKGFVHGTIQQTMHWLRENGWVKTEKEIPAHV